MRARSAIALLTTCLVALLLSPAAPAAAATEGGATLALGQPGKGLRVAGLATRAAGAASRRGQRLRLPAARIAVGKRAAAVRLRGGLLLSAGRRRAPLRQLRVVVRGRRAAITAKLGKRKLRLLAGRAARRAALHRGERVRQPRARLVLTRRAARLLRHRLGQRAIRAGAVVWLHLDARRSQAAGGDGGRGEKPDPVVEDPVAGPISGEPPRLERPDSAVDVSDVEIAWHPRDSWIRYVASGTGAGDGIFATNGASAVDGTESPCPDRPSSSDASLPYSFEFAPADSWYDPESGKAGIYGSGQVSFRWKAHTIDLRASDPEIEIAGADSRAIFRFGGSEGTAYPEQRADLVSLDLSGQPTVSNEGRTYSYDLLRGTLTENGVEVFAGFYTPPDNDEFGCVSVEFTTP